MMGRRGRAATGLRHASACSLLLLLSGIAGCRHKEPPAPAPVAIAPPITPSSITVITPLPSVPPQSSADVKPAPAPAPPPAPAPTPVKQKRRRRHKQPEEHKQPADNVASAADAVPATPEYAGAGSTAKAAGAAGSTATGGAPPQTSTAAKATGAEGLGSAAAAGPAATNATTSTEAAPALGQLSTGTSISSGERTRMLREIQVQEKRLSKQKEVTTADAHTLEMQAQTFLQKARQAVEENDLDGAQTLTTKARVLLDELQSE